MKRFIGLLFLALTWEVFARLWPNPIFPPFIVVIESWFGLVVSGQIWGHVVSSLVHVLSGFGLAAIIGLILGIAITQARIIDLILSPLVDSMRPIAALTIFPLLILALGLGFWSKAFVIFWTSWPAVLLNTSYGIRKVDRDVIEAAQLDGASQWAVLRFISFPLAVPAIMTGLRIGLSGGWISLVSAEMLGSNSGLGYSILIYSQTFRFVEMYAMILTIAGLGLAMNSILAYIQSIVEGEKNVQKVSSMVSPYHAFGDRAGGLPAAIDNGKSAGHQVRRLQGL